MEAAEVGQSLGSEPTVVRQRLAILEEMVQHLDYQLSPLASVVNRQSVSMWTDIPDCAVFGNEYADRLAKVQHGLIEVRDDVRTLFDALKLSAADLARTDDEIRERLDALADRLSDIPVIAEVGMPLAPRPAAGSDAAASQAAGSGEEWE